MSGFLSRVISLVLAFIMLVIAPLLYSYSISEMENRRLLLNEVNQFLDKVTDKGEITEDDLTEFYLEVSSYGMVIKPTVKRLVRTTVITPEGKAKTTYIAADDIYSLNQRDVVQVTLKEISASNYRRILSSFLRVNEGLYHLEMAAVVR
ncbi:hypothetical protein EDD66_101352 [Mobilisporobacter senegalensis]|uniref:Uncharacterized protein n=1 Tax=Mobilisporobacter senegalensis TaxID=1329262 RepID=A0A3N1XYS1_9FIRM|nr:hypothetical protein [Mobilisporobacter senegalensis]ROR31734.1 hypothetical protein EDD66_101352 [Mobilisporobacter senegalensis]